MTPRKDKPPSVTKVYRDLVAGDNQAEEQEHEQLHWIWEHFLVEQVPDNIIRLMLNVLLPSNDRRRIKRMVSLRRLSKQLEDGAYNEEALKVLEDLQQMCREPLRPEELEVSVTNQGYKPGLPPSNDLLLALPNELVVQHLRNKKQEVNPTELREVVQQYLGDIIEDTEEAAPQARDSDKWRQARKELRSEYAAAETNADLQCKLVEKHGDKGPLNDLMRSFIKESYASEGPSLLELVASDIKDGYYLPSSITGRPSGWRAREKQQSPLDPGIPDAFVTLAELAVAFPGAIKLGSNGLELPEGLFAPTAELVDLPDADYEEDGKELLDSDGPWRPSNPKDLDAELSALRSSSRQLRQLGTDPLQAAMQTAARLQGQTAATSGEEPASTSGIVRSGAEDDDLVEEEEGADEQANRQKLERHSDGVGVSGQEAPRGGRSSHLLKSHPSARELEWTDDDVEELEDNKRPRLPGQRAGLRSPARLRRASLGGQRQHVVTGGHRRVKTRWTGPETRTLIQEVRRHGPGKWVVILKNNAEVFENRTQVDLKDKWRNLVKGGLYVDVDD
eukprot:SM000113S24072  [mRNA]  locus=s113:353796:357061:+ [translate_table: standard]